MSGIRLSKKHGVNPTLGVCFYCGEDSGEIALLGKLKNDAEAPRRMALNYIPCKKCEEHMNSGVTLIEVDYTNPHDIAPISRDSAGNDVYPTSRWCVLTEEAGKRLFGDSISKGHRACADTALFKQLIPESES